MIITGKNNVEIRNGDKSTSNKTDKSVVSPKTRSVSLKF